MHRQGTLWAGGCFAAALALAVWAFFGFSQNAEIDGTWGLLLAAGGFALLGSRLTSAQSEAEEREHIQRRTLAKVESELEQQRNAVDTLADGLDVSVFVCDGRANILYANRRARELFRFENPIGRSLLAVTLSHDLEKLVMGAFADRTTLSAELSFTYPDERVGLARAWTPTDTPDRVFLSVVEITDLRRLERIRQDFVSNVSHELRTPLTIIRAMAETLLDDDEPDPALLQKYLSKIVSEVDRLSTISNDLLILSAAESNPVRKQACDVAEVFRSVVSQLQLKSKEKGLDLRYLGPSEFTIAANGAQMTQVALNLVDNAINYTPTGSVEVTVKPAGEDVVVEVRDTGVGIASEHQPRVFERFYRVDKARSRSTGGTGLGLSIVKHIVEAHGGRVTVESELGVGSTFRISLPVGEPSDSVAAAADESPSLPFAD